MNNNVKEVGDKNFDGEVTTDTPVLVDFWAPWCGPCKMMGPVIDQLADEYHGKIKVLKVNVDDNQSIATRFAIRGIPTIKLLKDGKEVFSASGAYPKDYWRDAIDQVLAT